MPSLRSLSAFVLLAAAAGGATVLGWQLLQQPPTVPPALDCPAEVNLGPRDFGSTAVGEFRIKNRGGSDLRLTGFGTSCSCAGVEMEQDGVAKRVEELRVPPGEHADLRVRISVGTKPGTSQTVNVQFTSNDPNHPESMIRFEIPRVTGGLSAEPAAVVFGEIPVGRPAAKTVRLYANGSLTRQVHAVRSLNSDRFSVRLVSLDNTEASSEPADRVVAVVEVTARTERATKLDGAIEVVLNEEGRASEKIAVLGEAVAAVIARPVAIVLPRSVNGRVAYSGQVGLTSRDGANLTVAIESVPDGLTAAVRPDPDNPGQWLLDVTAKPESRTARILSVLLRADMQPGGPSAFEVPITIHSANP